MEVQLQTLQQIKANHDDIRERVDEVRSVTIRILRHQPSIKEVADMQKQGEPAAEMIMKEGQKASVDVSPHQGICSLTVDYCSF